MIFLVFVLASNSFSLGSSLLLAFVLAIVLASLVKTMLNNLWKACYVSTGVEKGAGFNFWQGEG